MNIVKIMGGLGNQLCGYAFAKSLAKQGAVGLDISFFDTDDNHMPGIPVREYLLDRFTTDLPIATPSGHAEIYEKAYEPGNYYMNNFFVGYWQKGKYSKGIDLDIRLKDEYIPKDVKALADQMQKCNSVAIHVRRTDYALFKDWLLDMDYYKKAVKVAEALIDKPKFYVFSDDIEWCMDNLPVHATMYVTKGELQDFHLMQRAKNNIIANSTYSFWAANLNNNKDKIVIYPKNWKCTECPVDFAGWIGV